MTGREAIDKVLTYIRKEEDYYYEKSSKEINKGNTPASMILVAQATAYQRVRYFIEEL